MRRHYSRRGFTLAELLVGLVVTSIVLVAVSAVVIGVQNSYQAETEVKVVAESGRTALGYLERVLPMVGYGVDPRIAIDVTPFSGVSTAGDYAGDNAAVAGVTGTVVTDELRYRYRDPTFVNHGRIDSTSSPSTLTFDSPLSVALPAKTLLMLACRGAASTFSVRLSDAVAAGASSAQVELPQSTEPYRRSGFSYANSTDTCLQASGAASPWVYLVHEERLRVVNVAGRPWLVAYPNFTDDLVTNDSLTADGGTFDPIAPDVENFQVSFTMNRPPATGPTYTPPDGASGNWIIGDMSGETNFLPGVLTGPQYDTSYTDITRFTPANPANIRAVNVAFTVRTSRLEPTRRAAYPPASLFNYDAGTPPAVPDGYMRSVYRTVVYTPNLASRSFFNPTLRTSGDTRDFNTWGG